MSVGLIVFHALCDAGNTVVACRDAYLPGSDAWLALDQMRDQIDGLITALVRSEPLEDVPCGCPLSA